MNKIITKAAFIIVKSNRSTTQQAVAQDSNDRPNKLSRRTATRSQTRPGGHTCHPHTDHNLPVLLSRKATAL